MCYKQCVFSWHYSSKLKRLQITAAENKYSTCGCPAGQEKKRENDMLHFFGQY